MPFRLSEPTRPCEITLDGDTIVAQEGEPIAHALLAAGALSLARSPKFHRPRGPACLRGACDGCLMRVDGASNVMTCLAPARAGTQIAAQNTLGSRNIDFLRVTDWFFPKGINHHELFAGVPGVQGVMQAFARRVAGLGRLPDATKAPRTASRRALDVLVVGGGPSGLAAASMFADAGREVEVLDDGLDVGGSLHALRPTGRFKAIDILSSTPRGNLTMRARAVAGAVFPDGVLVVDENVTEILEPRVLVLAPGAHDGVLPFENNDLPGIFSARAGLRLLASGIAVGKRIVVAKAQGGGPYGDMFAAEVARLSAADPRAPLEVTVVDEEPVSAAGSSAVSGVTFAGAGKKHSLKCDALLVDAPRAPSYELPAQAGAPLAHVPAGFVVRAEHGRIRPGVYVIGEVTGAPVDEIRMLHDARDLLDTVRADGV